MAYIENALSIDPVKRLPACWTSLLRGRFSWTGPCLHAKTGGASRLTSARKAPPTYSGHEKRIKKRDFQFPSGGGMHLLPLPPRSPGSPELERDPDRKSTRL